MFLFYPCIINKGNKLPGVFTNLVTFEKFSKRIEAPFLETWTSVSRCLLLACYLAVVFLSSDWATLILLCNVFCFFFDDKYVHFFMWIASHTQRAWSSDERKTWCWPPGLSLLEVATTFKLEHVSSHSERAWSSRDQSTWGCPSTRRWSQTGVPGNSVLLHSTEAQLADLSGDPMDAGDMFRAATPELIEIQLLTAQKTGKAHAFPNVPCSNIETNKKVLV